MTAYIPERKLKPMERMLLILAVILVIPIAMFPPLLLAIALAVLPIWLVFHLVQMARTGHSEVEKLPGASRRLRWKANFGHHSRIRNHWTVNHDRPGSKY